jgi:3-deoxy-D-manno-octulosonate 8-phosphate phosphatase (KDO 8-P phosphatase)
MEASSGVSAKFKDVKMVVFDFDGVFTDNTVYIDQNGVESVRCWRGDGIGLDLLRQCNIQLAVVSTETNPVVEARCKKLKIRCISGVEDKSSALRSLCEELKVDLKSTCFMGNDRNDIPALKIVGIPVVVADANSSLNEFDFFRTVAKGGRGAVLELCQLIAHAIENVNEELPDLSKNTDP